MTPRAWPVRRFAPITGRRAWMAERAEGARWHAGVDLAAPAGTPVLAPEDGTVVKVLADANNVTGWKGYGPGVVVVLGRHSRVFHTLTHVVPSCAEGDVVQLGARVATVSNLAHVHYELRPRLMPAQGAAIIEDVASPVPWMERDELVRWDGSCPPRPQDSWRTPRACRPGWRGPRPAPVFPWPTPASSSSSSTPSPSASSSSSSSSSTPSSSSRTSTPSSSSGGGALVLVLALAAVAVAFGGRS